MHPPMPLHVMHDIQGLRKANQLSRCPVRESQDPHTPLRVWLAGIWGGGGRFRGKLGRVVYQLGWFDQVSKVGQPD
jgi:hypothetical protein